MIKNRYYPYNIDLEKELRTYKNIGKDYGNCKTADKGWILNVCRYLRKKRNKNNKNYFSCNTYSEWKDYILDKVNRNINNYDDLIHFLIREQNKALRHKEEVSMVLIPLEITIIALAIENAKTSLAILTAIVVIILIELIVLNSLYKASEKVEFYNDLIEIAKNK